MPRIYWLPEMTWPEYDKARSQIKLAIVPLGSTEQHGPGASFSLDTVRAEGFTKLLLERLHPFAVGLPAFPYAVSSTHMGFPGTITMSPKTMAQVIEQIALSMHAHGIEEVFFIASQAAHNAVLNNVASELRLRVKGLRLGWADMAALATDAGLSNVYGATGHADEAELSEALYLAPQHVFTHATSGTHVASETPVPHPAPVRVARSFTEVSRNGGVGDPGNASRQLGEERVYAALTRLVDYLQQHVLGVK